LEGRLAESQKARLADKCPMTLLWEGVVQMARTIHPNQLDQENDKLKVG
jgi:hypothetical protein